MGLVVRCRHQANALIDRVYWVDRARKSNGAVPREVPLQTRSELDSGSIRTETGLSLKSSKAHPPPKKKPAVVRSPNGGQLEIAVPQLGSNWAADESAPRVSVAVN